jgi:hypothetical protein
LIKASEGWVYYEVFDVTARAGIHDPFDRRTVALGLIAEVLGRGLMEAGAVDREGFAAWTCSPTEALMREASVLDSGCYGPPIQDGRLPQCCR